MIEHHFDHWNHVRFSNLLHRDSNAYVSKRSANFQPIPVLNIAVKSKDAETNSSPNLNTMLASNDDLLDDGCTEINALDNLLEDLDLFLENDQTIISRDSFCVGSEDFISDSPIQLHPQNNDMSWNVCDLASGCNKKRKQEPTGFNDSEQFGKRVRNTYERTSYSVSIPRNSAFCGNPDFVMSIPWELFGAVNTAVNSKDSRKLKFLTDQLFHEKCVLRWERSSVFSMEKTGATTMKNFFDALINTIPDGVIMIRNIHHNDSAMNGLELLTCKLGYTGTILYQHFMDEFQGFKFPHKSSVEYMDTSKISSDEIESLRKSEAMMGRLGLKIQIFGKLKVKFFIDPKSKKIIGYEEVFRMSSFHYVDTNDKASSTQVGLLPMKI